MNTLTIITPSASILATKLELQAVAVATDQVLIEERRRRPLTTFEVLAYKPLQQLQKKALSKLDSKPGKNNRYKLKLQVPELVAAYECLESNDQVLQIFRGKVHQLLSNYPQYIDLDT